MKFSLSLLIILISCTTTAQVLKYTGDGFLLLKDSINEEKITDEVYTAYLGEYFIYAKHADNLNEEDIGKYFIPKLFRGKHVVLQKKSEKWGSLTINKENHFEFIYDYQPFFINDSLYAVPAVVDGGYQHYYGYKIMTNEGKLWTEIRSIRDVYEGYFLVKYSDFYSIYDSSYNSVVSGAYRCTSWDDKNFGFNSIGNIALKDRNEKCGMVTYKGEVLLPFEYDIISDPFEEANLIKKDGLWGAVDQKGTLVIPIEYEVLEYDFLDSDTSFIKKDGMWMMVNNKLTPLNDKRFSAIEPDDRYHMTKIIKLASGMQGLMNFTKMSYLIPPEFDTLYEENNQFVAINKTTINYYDINGKLQNKLDPSAIQLFDDGGRKLTNYENNGELLIQVKKGKKGVILSSGEVIIPAEYDIIIQEYKKYFVSKRGQCGWLDLEGNVLIPCEYDMACKHSYQTIQGCNSNCIIMQKGNEAFLFDEKGQLISKKTFSTLGGACEAFD